MKKIVVVFIVALFSFIIVENTMANTITPDEKELSFAKKYFSLLYEYDVKAASFAEDSQSINTLDKLVGLFKLEKEHVGLVLSELSYLTPSTNYLNSYNNVVKGLHEQETYLINMLQDMKTGISFDEAFAMNNWKFLQAQKFIQNGVADLKAVIETYSNVYQLKIISATGITEKQLMQNASNCEYYRKVQECIK